MLGVSFLVDLVEVLDTSSFSSSDDSLAFLAPLVAFLLIFEVGGELLLLVVVVTAFFTGFLELFPTLSSANLLATTLAFFTGVLAFGFGLFLAFLAKGISSFSAFFEDLGLKGEESRLFTGEAGFFMTFDFCTGLAFGEIGFVAPEILENKNLVYSKVLNSKFQNSEQNAKTKREV